MIVRRYTYLIIDLFFNIQVNGEVGSEESEDEDEANLSVVGSTDTQNGNGSGSRRRHHKIAMSYNA